MHDFSAVPPGATGGCLCGRVRFRVDAPLREVVACHCGQCRRWSGHLAAFTAAPKAALALTGEAEPAWYAASAEARRGFCPACGSTLFWERHGGEGVSIAAGSLDDPASLRLARHIFVADKASYYGIEDALPKHARGSTSPLLDPTPPGAGTGAP